MRTKHLMTVLAGLVVGLTLTGCEITKTVYESPPDTTPPAVPRGVTSVTGDREITILWFESSERDLAGYGVYRSNSADCDQRRDLLLRGRFVRRCR